MEGSVDVDEIGKWNSRSKPLKSQKAVVGGGQPVEVSSYFRRRLEGMLGRVVSKVVLVIP